MVLKKYLKIITTPIKFKNNLPNFINKISKKFSIYLNDNSTLLHRWCHSKSEKYKFSCNWQKKLDAANNDNNLSKS